MSFGRSCSSETTWPYSGSTTCSNSRRRCTRSGAAPSPTEFSRFVQRYLQEANMRLLHSTAAMAALIVPLLLVEGCSQAVEKPDPVRPAKVMTVRPATGEDVMLFAGEVKPRYEIDLSFRIGGKLLERKVDLGA